MILAVAFLIAGLGLTLNLKGDRLESPPRPRRPTTKPTAGAGQERVIPNPTAAPHASGRGTPVGQVYRLPDGRLVYVKRPRDEGRLPVATARPPTIWPTPRRRQTRRPAHPDCEPAGPPSRLWHCALAFLKAALSDSAFSKTGLRRRSSVRPVRSRFRARRRRIP